MDNQSFEQIEIGTDIVTKDQEKFLIENDKIIIQFSFILAHGLLINFINTLISILQAKDVMNLFFYASAKSSVAEQFVNQLLAKEVTASLIVLAAGSELKCEDSLKLRNGDIMILFAATNVELQDLFTIHDKFEEFRVILILPYRNIKNIAVAHTFKPRFISFIDNGLSDLEKVITKMQGNTETQP